MITFPKDFPVLIRRAADKESGSKNSALVNSIVDSICASLAAKKEMTSTDQLLDRDEVISSLDNSIICSAIYVAPNFMESVLRRMAQESVKANSLR